MQKYHSAMFLVNTDHIKKDYPLAGSNKSAIKKLSA